MQLPSLLTAVFMLAWSAPEARLADTGVAATPPNIVFILADDLGWSDLGCYGSTFYETPHLDQLAAAGMRFTNAYAASSVCSPTRGSILSGKYPARTHLTEFIPGNFYPNEKLLPGRHVLHMSPEEVTIAEALHEAGYATALIGKWHLGRDAEYHPSKQGFEVVIDGTSGPPRNYFSPYRNAHLLDGPAGEYLTDRLTVEATRFIERNRDRPFFLYMSHNAVHTPVQGKRAHVEKYRQKLKTDKSQKDPTYAAMIQSLDEGVGRLLRALVEQAVADRTLVIFFSDNGGYSSYTNNSPQRGGKGGLYEGGIREPLIVSWPGVVKPGIACNLPVTSVDFYPTLLEIAGARGDAQHNHHLDGISLQPLLRDSNAKLGREAIYWHYPHYYVHLNSRPHSAIRAGDYKLIEFYEDGRTELYDLNRDVGERQNLAAESPDKVRQLLSKLHAWQARVNAQMPRPNPGYDPNSDRRYKDGRSFYQLKKQP